jgi:fluoroquinolone transport system permease protein
MKIPMAFKRLFSTMRCDVQLQFRNGFYYATAFVVAFWVVAFSQFKLDLGQVLPGMLLGNLTVSTFYFIGGLVLLEKSEGTLEAQVVTPLHSWEYIASKVITLAILSLIENVTIAVVIAGWQFNLVALAVGIALAAALFSLAGLVVIVRYDSVNEYLMPSAFYTAILMLPLLDFFNVWPSKLFYLHPMQAPLVIMQAAFRPVAGWQLIYGGVYSLLWIGLAWAISQRAFARFIVTQAGAR